MKKLVLLSIICAGFIACGTSAQQAIVPATAEPVTVEADPMPVEEPVVALQTEVPVTLPPLPTPTPKPTPTPEPTPEPTPTPIPFNEDEEMLILDALAYGKELKTVSTRGTRPSVYSSTDPDKRKYIYPFTVTEGVYSYEWIVLDTVETEERTFYHVRPIGASAEGYLDARNVQETRLTVPESIYAVMVRPHGIMYSARTVESVTAAHADYTVVRVIGVDTEKGYAAVMNTEGKTGYVQLGQIRFVDEETFLALLHQSCETPESAFSLEALVSDAYTHVGEPYADPASFLYDMLCAEGLHFNEVYYKFYQKPLEDETLYPKHLYITPIYNSLLFRLFNSSGDQVTCDGEETEWQYIGDYESIEAGDLLFFADDAGKGAAVIRDVEVVVHGPYSGDLTECGLYLGDGRMLTVRNGVVVDVEIDQISVKYFDSARRICPYVVDEKAHFIECMISAIYDRLGTPYSNARRIGDEAYDCSGLICWIFRGYDYLRETPYEPIFDLTASAWGRIPSVSNGKYRIVFADTGIARNKEELANLQRGDFVVLLNERRNKPGHIMVYLGNNTVIHSTRIDGRYQGTLVAQFRPHLQSLYSVSRRIESITPIG